MQFTVADATVSRAFTSRAGASPSSGSRDDTDFDWSHEGEAFLFPWFTIVMCDGRFLAPAGYPARQDVQKSYGDTVATRVIVMIVQRHSYSGGLISFINKLFIACSIDATKQPMFQEVVSERRSYGYRMYLMRFVIDFNEGKPLSLVPYGCQILQGK